MEYKRKTRLKYTKENCKPVYDKNGDIVMNRELFDLLCEEHNYLCEIEDKIENGTLVELPCPIRTMVYYIASLEKKIWFREKRKYCYTIMEIPFELEMLDSYGNNWFLTREEAEKRLEELKK